VDRRSALKAAGLAAPARTPQKIAVVEVARRVVEATNACVEIDHAIRRAELRVRVIRGSDGRANALCVSPRCALAGEVMVLKERSALRLKNR